MSADRCGMLETQATVRSFTGVGVNVDGDWEPWGEKEHAQNDHEGGCMSLSLQVSVGFTSDGGAGMSHSACFCVALSLMSLILVVEQNQHMWLL